MTLSEEVRELLQSWIEKHERYGKLQQALRDAKVCHAMVFIGVDGCVYPVGEVKGPDGEVKSVEETNSPKAHFANPQFLDGITAMLDAHINACDVCQGLLLPVSDTYEKRT